MQQRQDYKIMQIVLYIVDENVTLTFGFSAKINKIQIIKKN